MKVPNTRVFCHLPSLVSHTLTQALTVFLCISSPAHRAYTTCIAFLLDCIRRKPFSESLLRVLAITDGRDNALCFSASGSDYNAALSAPLSDPPSSRAQSHPTFSHSLPFSSFFVSRWIMADYNQHVRLLSSEPFGGLRFQSLLGPGSRHCFWNHFTQNAAGCSCRQTTGARGR